MIMSAVLNRPAVLSASARAAAKSVRELLVTGACLTESAAEGEAPADVVLVADGVLAALASTTAPASASEGANARAIALTTKALCALREGGYLLLVAQCFADSAAGVCTVCGLYIL